MEKNITVTTSWDDGHKLDLKLAKLLKKYGIKGTFYVSPNNREFKKEDLLTDAEIIQLSKDFEIGAHTMTHPNLTKISKEEAYKEILDSKIYLERLLGKEVKSFCYPGGYYDKRIEKLVSKSGFNFSRTTNQMVTKIQNNRISIDTTIQVFPLSLWGVLGEIKFCLFNNISLIPKVLTNKWDEIAKNTFDYVSNNGGVFHLWGHSWMIEKYNDWNRLDDVLKYISNRDVRYVLNSEVSK